MKVLVSLILTVISFSVCSQLNSVVHLKNGSAIRGEIINQDSTGLSLKTRDGSTWNFSADEIESVQKYTVDVRDKGFYNRTTLGVLGGDMVGGSLRVVHGYSFNRHWDTGFGIGLESMLWDGYVPVFLEGRYNFLKGSTRPFVSVHAGYLMPLRNMEFNKGGFSTGIDLGVTHYFSRHVGISTSVGYRFTLLKENSMVWDDFTTITQLNRFEIRLGFVFR